METNYIFVYGVLKSIYDNEPARFIRKNCDLIGDGFFSGMLLDLGNYPGAIFDANSESKVHGEVYKIKRNKDELVSFLDEFEGVSPRFDKPYEYKREFIPVLSSIGEIYASCYLYNWNPNGFPVIKDGIYKNEKAKREQT